MINFDIFTILIGISALIVAIFFVAIANVRSEWLLAAIFVSIPLTMINWDLGIQVFTLPEVLIYLALIGWILKLFFKKRKRFIKSPLNLPVIALMSVYTVAYIISPDFVFISNEFGSIKKLYNIVIPCLLFFLVANNVKRENVQRLTYYLIFAGVVASAIGFYYYKTGQVLESPELNRLTSTLSTAHGGFMVYMFFLSLGLLLGTRSKINCIILISFMIIFLIQIFLSGLRSSWISIIIISVLAWILKRKNLIQTSLSMVTGVLILISFIITLEIGLKSYDNPYVYRFFSLFSGHDNSVQSRLVTWRLAFSSIKKHPLIGAGLIGFRDYYKSSIVIPNVLRMGEKGIAAHNMYLDITFQCGIIGLCVLLWLLIVSMKQAYSIFRKAHNLRDKYIGFGILLAIINFSLWGLFDSPFFHMSGNNMPIFAILGLLSVLNQKEHRIFLYNFLDSKQNKSALRLLK